MATMHNYFRAKNLRRPARSSMLAYSDAFFKVRYVQLPAVTMRYVQLPAVTM